MRLKKTLTTTTVNTVRRPHERLQLLGAALNVDTKETLKSAHARDLVVGEDVVSVQQVGELDTPVHESTWKKGQRHAAAKGGRVGGNGVTKGFRLLDLVATDGMLEAPRGVGEQKSPTRQTRLGLGRNFPPEQGVERRSINPVPNM